MSDLILKVKTNRNKIMIHKDGNIYTLTSRKLVHGGTHEEKFETTLKVSGKSVSELAESLSTEINAALEIAELPIEPEE
jgi:hypothetical protein